MSVRIEWSKCITSKLNHEKYKKLLILINFCPQKYSGYTIYSNSALLIMMLVYMCKHTQNNTYLHIIHTIL